MNTTQKVKAWLPPTFPHRFGGKGTGCVRCVRPHFRELQEFPLPFQAALPPDDFEFSLDETPDLIIDLLAAIPASHWGSLDVENRECSAEGLKNISAHVNFATVVLPTGKRLEVRHTLEGYTHRRGITNTNRITNSISIWERLDDHVVLLADSNGFIMSVSSSDFTNQMRVRSQRHDTFVGENDATRASAEWKLAKAFIATLGIDHDNEDAIRSVVDSGSNYLLMDEDSPEVFIAKTMHGDLER